MLKTKDKNVSMRLMTGILVFVLAFSNLFMFAAGETFAASLKQPVIEKITPRDTEAKIEWEKINNQKHDGIELFRDGKMVTDHVFVKYDTWSYFCNDKGLTPGETYTYKIRTYTAKKQKQYYNSKTKKWVNSKPAAKYWKGKKTRTIKKKTYSKFSKSMKTTTVVYRTDLDNIRQEVLETFNYTAKDGKTTQKTWDKDLFESCYMADELNDLAQKAAEYSCEIGHATSFIGPDNDGYGAPDNVYSTLTDKYNSNVYLYAIGHTKKFDTGLIDRLGKQGELVEMNLAHAEDIAIGIGYCRGFVNVIIVCNNGYSVSPNYPTEWLQPYSRP